MEDKLEVLALQQSLNLLLTNNEEDFADQQQEPLMLRNVLLFIHKNFNKLNNDILMSDVLPILHHSLRMELKKGEPGHLGVYVCALLNLKEQNYDDTVQRCLQVLYQIMKTLSVDDTQLMEIGSEVFIILLELLLAKRSTRNNANILACLQLYVKKFNPDFITHIWLSIKDNLNSNEITKNSPLLHTLIFFFDELSEQMKDFKRSMDFLKLIQRLLESDHKDQRKSGYFILKKSHLFMDFPLTSHIDSLECIEEKRKLNFWTICITNFENLEENQSHLIIPSLEQLKNLSISDLTEQIFLDILYRHILRHNNILVRRWILEYLLETITYYSMTNQTQSQFMQALNEMALYSVEGYMLPTENIDRFLKCNKSQFLLAFSQIEWKAIPMHFWLTQLITNWKTVEVEAISHEVLVSLASKIRAMQNVISRQSNIALFKNLFSNVMENMELNKYVQLIEALYNVSDPYDDAAVLWKKIENCSEMHLDGDTIFTLRFYKILTSQFPPDDENLVKIVSTMEAKHDFNGWTAGSLRFLQVFNLHADTTNMQFCKYIYGINISCIALETPMNELYELFCEKLAKNDEERRLIIQKVTYFYARLWSFRDDANCIKRTEELLNSGSLETLHFLTNLLVTHSGFVGRTLLKCFVERLQDHLKDFTRCSLICTNITDHIYIYNGQIDDMVYFALMMLDLDLENVLLFDSFTNYINGNVIDDDFLIKGALIADTKVGDSRIEEAYQCKILLRETKCCILRNKYKQLMHQISDNRRENILKCLIEKIEKINQRKPRYYANSKEHRSIIRILAIIIELMRNTKFEYSTFSRLWKCLMEHNNQQNISILYQIAIADAVNWDYLRPKVEEQLKTRFFTPSQELSVIVILYRFFKLERNFKYLGEFQTLIDLLWPLTMGAHFQTRLYAQFALIELWDKFKDGQNNPPVAIQNLCCAIRRSLDQEQISKLKKDIRFMDLNLDDAFGEVMDFTNAPYDEYNFLKYSRFHKETATAQQNRRAIQTNDSILTNCAVQRKLNPVVDFMLRPNLFSYPDCKANMLYVVASLIDKIPNLGGIARTCDVLGIKNLVINSKKHIENPDFKNLSMTAENHLNIFEVKASDISSFILEKKTEGFKIVGAEQTTGANSCSFVNFKFPNRCVLVLGHEKEGIPPNLLAFLDYAVEIPQFGMVRSLNVHVTAAIFMWEYCKQHISGS